MAKAVHSMIRVLDEARSVAFYRDAFGLELADRLDFETFTLVYLRNTEAEFEVELTINKGRTEPYALGRRLRPSGGGRSPISKASTAASRRPAGRRAKIVEFNHDGRRLARFFFVADPDGYQIEVLQRHGRFR